MRCRLRIATCITGRMGTTIATPEWWRWRWSRVGEAGLRCHFDVVDHAGRRGNRNAILAHAVDVKVNRLAYGVLGLHDRRACGDAAREVGYVCGKPSLSVLDHYGVSHR